MQPYHDSCPFSRLLGMCKCKRTLLHLLRTSGMYASATCAATSFRSALTPPALLPFAKPPPPHTHTPSSFSMLASADTHSCMCYMWLFILVDSPVSAYCSRQTDSCVHSWQPALAVIFTAVLCRMLRRTTSATSMRKVVEATLPLCGTVPTGARKSSWHSSLVSPPMAMRSGAPPPCTPSLLPAPEQRSSWGRKSAPWSTSCHNCCARWLNLSCTPSQAP